MTADTTFEIPQEHRSKLRLVEPKDTRTDEEILAGLSKHTPITSEKNIWAFWDTGLESLPNWDRRNLIDWHRICGPSWTIRLLDLVPGSPNHALKWVDEDMLPEAFVKGTMEGPHVGPHRADLLRAGILWKHGGVWMDVGIILIRDMDRICWNQLANDGNPYELCGPWVDGPTIANHFVAGRKGSEFFKKWQELFSYLWSDRHSSDGLIAHPLLAFRTQIVPSKMVSRYKFPFIPEQIPTVMEYTSQNACATRLAVLEEPNGGFNGREFWKTRILKFDALDESFAPEGEIGFHGKDLFNILSTKRTGPDADPNSDEYKLAEKVIWKVLISASMQKITHGHGLMKESTLGDLWDLPENEGKDIEPGTFAELLRYGSVHFEQTREEIEYVDPEKCELVLRKGLLEA